MSESKLLVERKQVVVPGEVIAIGMDYLPGDGTYRFEDKVLANKLGLLMIDGKVLKTLPLAGRYLPKVGDVVIGRVMDILMSGWRIDIDGPYTAVLGLKEASTKYIEKGEDLTKYFGIDDYLSCGITQVTTMKLVDVTCRGTGLQKLRGGRIVKVNSTKVPRIIGKKGSMVSMIKNYTGCMIVVGQNGLIWVKGEPQSEIVATNILKKIEKESHMAGLTERIEETLKQMTGKSEQVNQNDELHTEN
ncbi:exosome complex RNA-binding protein Rrp4 [Nanoarchaeota archaeon]